MNTAAIWLPFALSLPILLVGVISFFNLLKSRKVNLLRIFLTAFALHFGLMPLYGFFIEWISGRWPYLEEEVLSGYFCLYSFLGGVLLVLVVYDFLPKHFRRGWTVPQLLEKQYRDIPLRQALIYFSLIVGFLIGFNVYFGFTTYASGTLERNLTVPYPLVVVKSLSVIFVCGLVGYGALHLIRGKKYMLLGLLLLCSQNFLDLYSRRKYLLAVILLVLLKLLLDKLKISLRQVVITAAAGLFVLQVFFPFLYVFRQLTIQHEVTNKKGASLAESYDISQGSRGEALGKGLDENVAFRANQIARNIDLMRLPQSQGQYMNGLIFAYQLSAVVPRALNPAKLQTMKVLSPEAIILLFYGRKNFDMTDNLPLYGYLEFGYWGAFFVGILQALFLIIFERFVFLFHRIHPFLGLSVLMYAVYNHLNMEYPYQQELTMIRDLIILFFIAWPISFLYGVFFKKQTRQHISNP